MNPDERDAGLTALYRCTAEETPPGALDARILSAARRAVARGRWWRWPRMRSWGVPMASAAVALMALSLAVFVAVDRQGPGRADRGPEPTASFEPEPAAPAREQPAQPHDGRPALDRVEPKAFMEERAATEDLAGEHRWRQASRPPAPAVEPQAASANMGGPASSLGLAAPSPLAKSQPREAAGDTANSLPPEPWLARIQALLTVGRRAEAAAELARFRHAYPAHPIPPTLRSIAPAPED